MAKKKKSDTSERVSCSLTLPRSVWRAAKIQALDEDRDFQSLVADALRLYLQTHKTKEAQNVK